MSQAETFQQAKLPLAGIRVLAWEQAVAAPLASRHLADLGADVIKIEPPGRGDFARQSNAFVNGMSSYFAWANHSKKSVVLDLKSDFGREVFNKMIESADVLLHNQGPGVADKLGFSYAQLSARNPRLIYCAISGYGPTGPYANRRAYDALIQGESGLVAMTGTKDIPSKTGASIADIATAMYAFGSIVTALYARASEGRGAEINISMLDSLVEWIGPQALSTRYTGKNPQRVGNRHPAMVPQGGYKCADGFVNLAVQNERQWERLCHDVLLAPELASDARFASNQLRIECRDIVEPLIEAHLGKASRDVIESRLEAAGLPYGRVNEVADVLSHPQLEWRNKWFETTSPVGPITLLHHPFNIEGMPRRPGPVPGYGEHTDEVLAEYGFAAKSERD